MTAKKRLDYEKMQILKTEFTRFMMSYKFAIDELNTKINILIQEFEYMHDYNPIEHVKSRLKSPESILDKVYRKGYELTLPSIKENVQDIAGIRITCSFISDIYVISKMLQNQSDTKVIMCKDYIKNPKPNGYKSLHLILEVPIYMSDRKENICAEVQIRTIAMDFWASLEHKIYYKYDGEVPSKLLEELKEAADHVANLDEKMERINEEIKLCKTQDQNDIGCYQELSINEQKFYIPHEFFTEFALKRVE